MKKANFNNHITSAALHVCRKISDSGEDVYVVGGTLRDILLGRTSLDIDLATTATPEKIISVFSRVIPTGIKHGTVTILKDDEQFEVTTLRGEDSYSDGRRPDSVTYLKDIREDLARRDFTINAIAWDPIKEKLHDPFDGQKDLAAGLIRAVGNPLKRFTEDGLRVLRAARFATTHNFEIEQATEAAIPKAAKTLGKVAAERKRDELLKILKAKKPSRGFTIMRDGQLLPYISTDLANLGSERSSSDKWAQTLTRIDTSADDLHVRLASLFLGIADAAKTCSRWLKDMRFDKKTISITPELIRSCEFTNFETWKDADVRRFVKKVGKNQVKKIIEIKRAEFSSRNESTAPLETLNSRVQIVLDSGHPLEIVDLAIGGKELVEKLNISPGPEIGKILASLLEHVLEHPEENVPKVLLKMAEELSD